MGCARGCAARSAGDGQGAAGPLAARLERRGYAPSGSWWGWPWRRLLPLVTQNNYVLRVAGLTGLYAILALGLNVVAGLAGLLDLGYVAFYGLGAYLYALLASPQFGQHWPFLLLLPLVVLAGLLCGLVLGAPSLRLRGDYLAIVTLGFGQIANLLLHQPGPAGAAVPGCAAEHHRRAQRDHRHRRHRAVRAALADPNALLLPDPALRGARVSGRATTWTARASGGRGGPSARTSWPRRPWG